MSADFRSIDIKALHLPDLAGMRLTRVDLPFNRSIPFAIVHYTADEDVADDFPTTLRLDLGKRVFLDNIDDPRIQDMAAPLSAYLGEIRRTAEPEPHLAACEGPIR